jgi:hypothetical protein
MIVSIHQPEHFPYLGFFQKMQACDLFVILDNVKFRKNYYQNRNRFLNRSGNEEWFTVPVEKNSNSKLISDVLITQDQSWKKKVVKQIKFNLGHDVEEIYNASNKICDINMSSINWCRDRLNIKTPMILASSLGVEGNKTDLIIDICKKLDATEYIAGSSGRDYLITDKFDEFGIKLTFFEPKVDNMMSTISNIR